MQLPEVLSELSSLSDPKAVEGMARFGIKPEKVFGIAIPALRDLAKRIRKNHALAAELWASGIHEARILASMIDDPRLVTEEQMEKWVSDFDSWDVCDQCVMNLFEDVDLAWSKAVEWSARDQEFVKRAGFVLMARLAVSDKKAADERFEAFLPLIVREAGDNRNFVKKAVNWALRQIGKRNLRLNRLAVHAARSIQEMDSLSARWIASDALKELTGEGLRKRLKR